jgi:hypothetical protein
MSTVNIGINQLPVTNEIINGDYLIVDNGIETRRLDFKDFIVGLDNVTFASTISSNSSDILSLSSAVTTNTLNISSLSSTFYGQTTTSAVLTSSTHYIKIRINGANYAIMLSATN